MESTESALEVTKAAIEATISATSSAQSVSFLSKIADFFSKIKPPAFNVNIPLLLGLVFFFGLLFLLWITLVYYVIDDMEQRPMDPNMRNMILILTIGFNFIGFLIYVFIRPPTFEEIEMMEKEKELIDLELKKLRREFKDKGKSK